MHFKGWLYMFYVGDGKYLGMVHCCSQDGYQAQVLQHKKNRFKQSFGYFAYEIQGHSGIRIFELVFLIFLFHVFQSLWGEIF